MDEWQKNINIINIIVIASIILASFYFNKRSVKYIQSIVNSKSKTNAIILFMTISSAISFMFYIAYVDWFYEQRS
jgi:hypothetical protein